ncbi:MAG TPA: RNA-binding S4 domain-containing protein [Burkholderiales bacterium]
MRIDKWLWNASLFNTRGLAQSAVEAGRVTLNGERCAATQDVKIGDRVVVGMGEFDWDVTVRALELDQAFDPNPRDLYEEDEDSLARRAQTLEARKLTAATRRPDSEGNRRGPGQGRPPGRGRPAGRERRPKQKFRRR